MGEDFPKMKYMKKRGSKKKKNKNFVSSLRSNDNGNSVAVLFPREYELGKIF